MPSGSVSVVIATRNRPASLACLMSSLVTQLHQKFEVLIGLNGRRSWDEQCDKLSRVLSQQGVQCSVIELIHLCHSEVHAELLHRAAYELVCRVDDDHVLTACYLAVLRRALCQDRSISAVGGIVLHPGLSRQRFTRNEFRRLLGRLSRGSTFLNTELQLKLHPTHAIIRVPDLYSTFMVRRRHVEVVGGIATCYRISGYREETDLTLRLSRSGYGVAIVPDAVAWHIRATHGGERRSQAAWQRARQINDKIFHSRLASWG